MDSNIMRKLEIQPFVKYVVLKVDLLLETEIVDEENFGADEEFAIMQFKRKCLYYIDISLKSCYHISIKFDKIFPYSTFYLLLCTKILFIKNT